MTRGPCRRPRRTVPTRPARLVARRARARARRVTAAGGTGRGGAKAGEEIGVKCSVAYADNILDFFGDREKTHKLGLTPLIPPRSNPVGS